MGNKEGRGEQTIKFFARFVKYEASSSILLLLFATIALLWTNSPFAIFYFGLFNTPIVLNIAHFQYTTSLNHIINDWLMTLFFLLVTLEVKRELLIGELNTLTKALLPVIGALGGMLLPAAIYLALNANNLPAIKGWAIPTATDIAFSLAILSLLRNHLPYSLKVFLTNLAIVDDLGAIIIIAIFYTSTLNFAALALAILCVLFLIALNYLQIKKITPYILIGIFLLVFVNWAGIHPTIAGVIVGFALPYHSPRGASPLKRLEHFLHPWIAFFILPVFSLANTGLSFKEINQVAIFDPITLGILCGLFIGKQCGVFSACWLAVKLRLGTLPHKMKWRHLYGLSIICGIGFTMSLFIGDLAFGQSNENLVKLGVLIGSLASGIVGALVLWYSAKGRVKDKKLSP